MYFTRPRKRDYSHCTLFETLSNNAVLDFPLHMFLSEIFSAEDKKIVQHGMECNAEEEEATLDW